MHLLETYSLLSGANIQKCFIDTQEYNLPYNQYITLHADCDKAPARQYKKWHEVIHLLKQNKNFNIPIIQIGSLLDNKYDVDLHLTGQTNINELAYIIQNCSLHIGYDSFPMHLASHFDKKMVVIFAYYAKSSGPYFSSPTNIRLIEPNFAIKKPSFNYTDPNNLINTIDPIVIYNNIIDLLGIQP